MTIEEAIKILKSKLDGSVDTSWEWTKAVRMAIKALEDKRAYCMMADRPCFAHGTQIAWCLSCPHISEEDRNLVRKAVEGLDPKTWWIPVSEALPSGGQVVLAIGDKGTWDVGKYQGTAGWTDDERMWKWKKKTVKRVEYWMPKDAIPLPNREDGE